MAVAGALEKPKANRALHLDAGDAADMLLESLREDEADRS